MCLFVGIKFGSESEELNTFFLHTLFKFANADPPISVYLYKMETTSILLINAHFWNIKKNFLFSTLFG